MHLISSLASGLAAATNGTAQIYIRGNSTRATVYNDFEASSSDSSGADIVLDAHGSALVYVNQLVDVVVKDSDGVIVREFTAGDSSPNVEVRSLAFTGVDYVTGVSAAGNPTTLQEVLDLWKANSGAIDWKVLIAGSAVTLQTAFGSLNGLVFNVKSPAYGAVGNGVDNDQSAIAAALEAAVAAGGGIVFFPKGTYLTTTAIDWDHRVSILGIGARESIITTNSPSNARILTWTTGTAQAEPIWIAGMSFAASQANTGEQLYATVVVNLCIERCGFGASSNATGTHISITGASKLRIMNSRLTVNGAAGTAAALSATGLTLFSGCYFDTGNTSYSGSFLKATGNVVVESCDFDQSVNASGLTVVGVEILAATDVVTIRDSRFVALAQNFQSCIKLFAGAYVTTQGNDYGGAFPQTRYSTIATPLANGSHLELGGVIHVNSSSTSFTVTDGYEVAEFWLTGTVPTIAAPTKFFPGQRLLILVNNQSGGDWANTAFTSGISKYGTVDLSALIGHIVVVEAVVCALTGAAGTTYVWVAVHAKGDSL